MENPLFKSHNSSQANACSTVDTYHHVSCIFRAADFVDRYRELLEPHTPDNE
jgi:hypothetical protein